MALLNVPRIGKKTALKLSLNFEKVPSERIFQAIAIARYAKEIGADAIAHGSTGAGNDQIRFDMTFLVMAPGVEIITLTRDKALSRKEEVDYLNEHGFYADFTKLKYSYNVGIWGTSICGGEILDPTQGLPEEAYLKHVTAKEEEAELKITFEKGEIVAVNGEKFDDKIAAIQKIEEIGASYAIGRDCNVGDTIIGIKGRVAFEAAAPKLIIEAHRLLEKSTLSKWQQYWKDQVGNWYGMFLHESQYLEPVMPDIEAMLTSSQRNVNGTAILKLRPYSFQTVGIDSPDDLTKSKLGEYGEMQHGWTAEDGKKYELKFKKLDGNKILIKNHVDSAMKIKVSVTPKEPIDDTRVQFFFKSPINDGGTFCGVADLADKYGVVPMSIVPETYSAENTSRISRLVASKLREFGLELRDMVAKGKNAKAINERKTQMLATVYNMLSMTLGEPVKEFTYAFTDKNGKTVGTPKKYTPKEFFHEVVGDGIKGTFIMVMNDPRRPYHKTYEVEYDRHTYDGTNWKYLNLPMDEIAQLAIASLKDGRKMYSSYDVGKQYDRKRGLLDVNNYDYASLFSTTFGMDKAQRISTFDSGSTHAMTLSAVDLDANGKPLKWKVENSWGPTTTLQLQLTMLIMV